MTDNHVPWFIWPVNVTGLNVLEHSSLDIDNEIRKWSNELNKLDFSDPYESLEFNQILEDFSKSPTGIIYNQKRRIALLISWDNEWDDDILVQTVRKALRHWIKCIHRHGNHSNGPMHNGFFSNKHGWFNGSKGRFNNQAARYIPQMMNFIAPLEYCWTGEVYNELILEVAKLYFNCGVVDWVQACSMIIEKCALQYMEEWNVQQFHKMLPYCRQGFINSSEVQAIAKVLLQL